MKNLISSRIAVVLSVFALSGFCLAGSSWAADDDEKAIHDAARAVLGKAKVDLSKAIEAAQAKAPKGKPIFAITEKEDDKLMFAVFLLVGDKVTEIEVDALTGKAMEAHHEGEDHAVEDLPAKKKALAAAKTTLAKALVSAKEKVKGGKAFEVGFGTTSSNSVITIEMLSGPKIMVVEIDAVTGKVLSVEEEME